jgi:hypothetical protein
MAALTATVRARVLETQQQATHQELELICVDKALKRRIERVEKVAKQGPIMSEKLVNARKRQLEASLPDAPSKARRLEEFVEQGRSRLGVRLEQMAARAAAEVEIMTREKARVQVEVRDRQWVAEKAKREFETLAGVLAKNGISVAPLQAPK